MKTKLQRAVDATLEKYEEFLEKAQDLKFGQSDFWDSGCAFCKAYPGRYGNPCWGCPIDQVDGSENDVGCIPVLRELEDEAAMGDTVPAILAAMIYLWGFVEE